MSLKALSECRASCKEFFKTINIDDYPSSIKGVMKYPTSMTPVCSTFTFTSPDIYTTLQGTKDVVVGDLDQRRRICDLREEFTSIARFVQITQVSYWDKHSYFVRMNYLSHIASSRVAQGRDNLIPKYTAVGFQQDVVPKELYDKIK